LSFGVASISGSIAAFYSELFDTRIRYTGLVFAKEVSGAVVGGFTSLISTLLVQWSGDASWPVSVYMMVTALAAFLCAHLARDILDVGQRNVTTATKRDALVGVRQVMDDTGDHARCTSLNIECRSDLSLYDANAWSCALPTSAMVMRTSKNISRTSPSRRTVRCPTTKSVARDAPCSVA
jgi:hypothetical protein